MRNKDIINTIEAAAPVGYQESYDNTGWQVGNPDEECTGVLIALDVTMEVLREALESGCNLIIAHHPLLFGSIKKLTGRNYVERIIIKAIQESISIYACHTNLDNMARGVNARIAARLGLKEVRILQPSAGNLLKLVTYVPSAHSQALLDALWKAGAGSIGNYRECSFSNKGTGTFRPSPGTNPTIGTAGGGREELEEVRIELLVQQNIQHSVIRVLKDNHPYEEVAYELYPLTNENQYIGAGMYGFLEEEMPIDEFLRLVKEKMKAEVIRYTPAHQKIRKVAICGGSGSFLLGRARALACDVLLTADFKYHQFFDAEGHISIMDIGHYESEQFTSEIFYDIIKDKFPNFALRISKINTNPINYYY